MLKLSDVKTTIPPNSIVNGDCFDVFPYIPDNSIDMVLTDLPYAQTCIHWDIALPLDKLWEAYKRVCKPSAAIVLTATQPFSSVLVASKPDWFKYEIIWVKNKATGHLNAKKQPMRNHESILVFYQSPPTYNPQMTLGHEPLHYAINKNQTKLYGKYGGVESRTGATDRYPKSVVYFDVVNQSDRVHETQKPVELFQYLIETYSNEGDLILDHCCGSGTTGVAAKITNRKYILIEKDEKYVLAACNRFKGNILDE